MESIEKFQISEPETEVKKEKPEVEDVLKNELESVIVIVETTNNAISKEEHSPVVSSQEQRDLQMESHVKGYGAYWVKRLIPELDILPSDVQSAVKKMAAQKHLVGHSASVFDNYINKRLSILDFNIQKRETMARLKNHLKGIDERLDYVEQKNDRQTIFYEENSKELFTIVKGEKQKVTFGDVVADYEWGVKYTPDKSMPEKIWRKIRKLSDLTQARREVEQIFNTELSSIESIPLPTTSMTEEFLEKHKDQKATEGIIAERMVKNLLIRAQYNNQELSFRVEPSNAVEDCELKYDFKVMVPEKRRGVAIESVDMTRESFVENKRKFGIQFTISGKLQSLRKKAGQIKIAKKAIQKERYQQFVKKPVDDIILVTLPAGIYGVAFKKWLSEGKPAGGPEQYLNKEEKTKIFREVSKNFLSLSETEIENLII